MGYTVILRLVRWWSGLTELYPLLVMCFNNGYACVGHPLVGLWVIFAVWMGRPWKSWMTGFSLSFCYCCFIYIVIICEDIGYRSFPLCFSFFLVGWCYIDVVDVVVLYTLLFCGYTSIYCIHLWMVNRMDWEMFLCVFLIDDAIVMCIFTRSWFRYFPLWLFFCAGIPPFFDVPVFIWCYPLCLYGGQLERLINFLLLVNH